MILNVKLCSFFHHRVVLIMMRWGVAGVFAYAGFQKILNPQGFADSIASFVILLDGLINLVALSLPPVELLLAVSIVINFQRRAALLGLVVLTTGFMVALGTAMLRGIAIDCGCFGAEEPSIAAAGRALLRDTPLLMVVAWLCWIDYNASCQPSVSQETH